MTKALQNHLESKPQIQKVYFDENGNWQFHPRKSHPIVKTREEVLSMEIHEPEPEPAPKPAAQAGESDQDSEKLMEQLIEVEDERDELKKENAELTEKVAELEKKLAKAAKKAETKTE